MMLGIGQTQRVPPHRLFRQNGTMANTGALFLALVCLPCSRFIARAHPVPLASPKNAVY